MPKQRIDSSSKKSDPRLEENVSMLFEELELAVKWDRPSLLLAVYKSEAVRAKAEKRLATRLTRLHQRINALPVDESHYDIALELIGAKPAGKVFFVSNLIYGGGKNSANAYRALNIRRELLIENKTRVIFWLADYEFSLLPYFAPDFWAFRHRVIDFTKISEPATITAQFALVWDVAKLRSEADRKIPLLETVLVNLPANAETGPTRAELLIALAGLHWANNDSLKASKNLQASLSIAKSLDLREEQHRAFAGLGVVSAALGAEDNAIRFYRQALDFFQKDALLWDRLAQSFLQLGWYKRALGASKKATMLAPATASYWLNLGRIYSRLGNPTEALEALRRAVRIEVDYVEAWVSLGDMLNRTRKIKAALQCYLKATRLDRQSFVPWWKLAALYFQMGENASALRTIKKAISLSPQTPALRHMLGVIQQDLGNYQAACAAYQQALDSDNAFVAAHIALASCCLEMKDANCFEQQMEYIKVYYHLATPYDRVLINVLQGRFGRALQLIRTAIKTDNADLVQFEREPVLVQFRRDPRFQLLYRQRTDF